MKTYHLLSDQKLFNKICRKINSDYNCADAFACSISCPAWIMNEAQMLMNCKGLTLGEAYRMTQRGSLEMNDALKVIREIKEGKRFYPESCPLCKRLFERRSDEENNDKSISANGSSGR